MTIQGLSKRQPISLQKSSAWEGASRGRSLVVQGRITPHQKGSSTDMAGTDMTWTEEDRRDRRIEILAPAGSYASFRAALCAGADAVYAGGPRFGARAYADNFSQEGLVQAVGEAHLFGRKFYLTVNTLLKENEIAELYDYLAPLYEAGLDAVIVQDAGVMEYVRRYFPGLDIHASTQMTVTGAYGAKFLKGQGVTRIVPARELSLGEIRRIRRKTSLEIECFVHGALCYCYSGQCLLSSMIGGRSGNRGQCAQPCRLPYTAGGEKKYYLSSKDICTLEIIPDLVDAGINSFKIEGRMKKPEYVAGVTSMYRKYTDLYLREGRQGFIVSPADRERLMDLYNRGGSSEGYYKRHNGRGMLALDRPNHTGVPAVRVRFQKGRAIHGTVLTDLNPGDVIEVTGGKGNYTAGTAVGKGGEISFLVQKGVRLSQGTVLNRIRNEALIRTMKENYGDKDMKLEISGKLSLRIAEPAVLKVQYRTSDGVSAVFTAETQEAVQKAQSRPMDKERILSQIQKTGNSEFVFRELHIHMDDGIFVPIQQLNALRRAALEGLREAVMSGYARTLPEKTDAGSVSPDPDRVLGRSYPAEGDVSAESTPMESSPMEWKPRFSVLAETEEQLRAVRDAVIQSPGVCDRIYIETELVGRLIDSGKEGELFHGLAERGTELLIAMPHILRREEGAPHFTEGEFSWLPEAVEKIRAAGVLIRNYEEYQMLRELGFDKKIILDHNLYVFNRYGKMFWEKLGISGITVPQELNARELDELGIRGMELPVYGHLPVMVTAQCLVRTTEGCTGRTEISMLTDRLGNRFPVKNQCAYCYNVIYNTQPLYLGMQEKEIRKLAPGMLRLQFSIESGERVRYILDLVRNAFCGDGAHFAPDFEYTQGHFRRGVS